MSRFCVKCGHPAGDGGFCTGCGSRLESNNSTGPSSPTPANTVARASSAAPARGGMLKVILIAAGGIVLLDSVLVGGLVYAGYRVTSKAKQVKEEYGLGSIIQRVTSAAENENKSFSPGSTAPSSKRDACSFMTKEEVGAAGGTTFSSASLSDDNDVCTYEPADDDSVTVVVDVKRQGGALAMKVLPKFSEELGEGDIRRPITGIGDEAFLLRVDEKTQKGLDDASPDLKALTSFATGPLVFRKGEVWVAVTETLSEHKGEVQKKIAAILATRI